LQEKVYQKLNKQKEKKKMPLRDNGFHNSCEIVSRGWLFTVKCNGKTSRVGGFSDQNLGHTKPSFFGVFAALDDWKIGGRAAEQFVPHRIRRACHSVSQWSTDRNNASCSIRCL
jgi:hypothetical protein